MNVILILIDSLNRSALSAYRDTPIRTPNLSAFAQRAWRFDNHFVGSLPCMPARREIFSGFKELMWRPWGPLEPFDRRLPKMLEDLGYATGIVTDHYHYWEESANGYLQAFQSTDLVRGHELDAWKPLLPNEKELPAWVRNIEKWRPGSGRRYYSNVADFRDEADFFPAQVMSRAAEWLERRDSTPFFLQVESFDVHEPFDVPEPYASMYGEAGARERYTVWPPYQDPADLHRYMKGAGEEELAFIRSQYAAKLTMVDRWFGELLATLDELALWQDTAVIVTTDHGHDLGARGVFGKQFPHWDSHANIPLLVWHPRHPGPGAIDALTTTVDLFASILDVAGEPAADGPHSQSFMPLVAGAQHHRDCVMYGTFGQGVCITDGAWTLIKAPEQDGPLYSYSSLLFQSLLADRLERPAESGDYVPGAGLPQWKVPIRFVSSGQENLLFHRAKDPDQLHDLWDREPQQRRRMLDLLHDVISREGAPAEQFRRLGLPA